jgi:hypothetical protein
MVRDRWIDNLSRERLRTIITSDVLTALIESCMGSPTRGETFKRWGKGRDDRGDSSDDGGDGDDGNGTRYARRQRADKTTPEEMA